MAFLGSLFLLYCHGRFRDFGGPGQIIKMDPIIKNKIKKNIIYLNYK
jgi:hypothetical protein